MIIRRNNMVWKTIGQKSIWNVTHFTSVFNYILSLCRRLHITWNHGNHVHIIFLHISFIESFYSHCWSLQTYFKKVGPIQPRLKFVHLGWTDVILFYYCLMRELFSYSVVWWGIMSEQRREQCTSPDNTIGKLFPRQ